MLAVTLGPTSEPLCGTCRALIADARHQFDGVREIDQVIVGTGMGHWQLAYLCVRQIPRELSDFELVPFFTFSPNERILIPCGSRPARARCL